MRQTIINFNMHQPLRLFPGSESFVWEVKNREVFEKSAKEYYLPTLEELAGIVASRPEFRFSLGMSGTFLEQAKQYSPELIALLKDLSGYEGRVEFLDETFYNSLAGLYADKTEFISQVSDQRTALRELFGRSPMVFRHTKRLFTNEVGQELAEMGFKVMLTDLPGQVHGELYKTQEGLLLIPRDISLSHAISRGGLKDPARYARMVKSSSHEVTLMGYALGRVGGPSFKGFWKRFADQYLTGGLLSRPGTLQNPSGLVDLDLSALKTIDVKSFSSATWNSWEDAYRDTEGLINNQTEYELFKRIEALQGHKGIPEDIRQYARTLTQFDHLRFLHDDPDSPSIRGNPYSDRVNATYVLTTKVSELESRIADAERSVKAMRRRKKDVILQISNEVNSGGGLLREFGFRTELIDNGVGGQAIAVDNLSNGLLGLGYETYIETIDMPERNKRLVGKKDLLNLRRKYAGLPDRIFVAKSPAFDNLMDPYVNKAQMAAALQLHAVYHTIPELLKRTDGALIIDAHDGASAGIVYAFAEKLARQAGREFLFVYHAHNVHDVKVPRYLYQGLENHPDIVEKLFWEAGGRDVVMSALSGLSHAHEVITVSPEWDRQLRTGEYMQGFVPGSFAHEYWLKSTFGQTHGVLNRPSPSMYPENNKFLKDPRSYAQKYTHNHDRHTNDADLADRIVSLIRPFGPDMSVEEYEKVFMDLKEAVQIMTFGNANPAIIDIVYCGRVDPRQKNTHLFPHVFGTLIEHYRAQGRKVRFLIQGDQTPNEFGQRPDEDALREFAFHHSSEQAAFFNFRPNQELEALSAAAADLVIGPSNEEMGGNNDFVAYFNGAFGSFSHRGGYKDKGEQLRLKVLGATKDHGNCYFHEPNAESMIHVYKQVIDDIVFLKENHPKVFYENRLRIMREAREKFPVEHMALETLAVYEKGLGRKLI